MCLISFCYRPDHDIPLVLVSSRDEYHDRPTAPLRHWPGRAGIRAGQDLAKGGLWLGLNDRGRWCAVTNVREPSSMDADLRTRGALTRGWLSTPLGPEAWFGRLETRLEEWAGFNLLMGEGRHLWYCSNRNRLGLHRVPPGWHSLSNASLDSPWPKSRHALAQLIQLAPAFSLPQPDRHRALLEAHRRSRPFPDSLLPDTGLPLTTEQRLSPPCIIGRRYGTRAISSLVIDSNGTWLSETQLSPAGGLLETTSLKI